MTLALLIMAVGGAWAGEEPQLLTTINASSSFLTGSQTFDDIATVTFGGAGTVAFNNNNGWIQDEYERESTVTVTAVDGYTITSIKLYAADSNKTISTSPFTAYLNKWGATYVTTGTDGSGDYVGDELVRIEVYGYKSEPEITEWSLTPDDTGKTWTLAEMPASNIELQVEYEPTKVTMAANDKTMGTVEVSGESKVEWTADTWKGWTSDTKTYTVDDITMTSTNSAYINEYTYEGVYLHSLSFFVNQTDDNSTVTFSTTGDPFSRIEFTMIDDYAEDEYFNYKWHGNPTIMPKDNWTFEGKSAVWEGEATKSLTLQSCSTQVSKITFFKGAVPDGVTVNGDGTFTVAKTATVTLTATPKEGYKFLYWEDDQTNTNPVREVTIESGMADMTYTAVFEEITYNVTFVEGTDLNEWTATPNTEVKKDTKVDIKYTGAKKVIGVKVEKNNDALSTLLTIEAITAGTIVVNNPKDGMKYKLNGVDKGAVTSTAINVSKDDKVAFYGTATSYNGTQFAGTAEVKVYGNIMSLVSADFADNKVLTADNAFANLFKNYANLKDASALLLPATTLTNYCYGSMFMGCSNLTAAPKLPATTLATDCYYRLFKDCTSLKEVYVKAAYDSGPCTSMFFNCSAADATLHTTSDNKASWTGNVPENWTIDEGWTD